MSEVTVEVVAEEMYKLIAECEGKKSLKPGDVTKAMIAQFGPEACNKELCKQAIRILIDSGRCVYTYFGGSYIALPPKADAAER